MNNKGVLQQLIIINNNLIFWFTFKMDVQVSILKVNQKMHLDG